MLSGWVSGSLMWILVILDPTLSSKGMFHCRDSTRIIMGVFWDEKPESASRKNPQTTRLKDPILGPRDAGKLARNLSKPSLSNLHVRCHIRMVMSTNCSPSPHDH